MRVKITLACSECKQRNYDTKKNKKNEKGRCSNFDVRLPGPGKADEPAAVRNFSLVVRL